jgi:hypothetical protein
MTGTALQKSSLGFDSREKRNRGIWSPGDRGKIGRGYRRGQSREGKWGRAAGG